MNIYSHHKPFIFYYSINNITNEFYYGETALKRHQNGYIGSGAKFFKNVKKYGKENFTSIIIESFDTKNEAKQKEREVVTPDLLKNPLCLNTLIGGGGWDYGDKFPEEVKQKISIKRKGYFKNNPEAIINLIKQLKNIKPVKCKKCKKYYKGVGNLKQHEKSCTKLICIKCNKTFYVRKKDKNRKFCSRKCYSYP